MRRFVNGVEMLSVSLQYHSLCTKNEAAGMRDVMNCNSLPVACRSSYMGSIFPVFWCVEHAPEVSKTLLWSY